MSAKDAVTALRRFGLGARPGESRRIASDPRSYVDAQIDPASPPEIGGFPTSAQLWQETDRFRIARKEEREAAKANTMDNGMGNSMDDDTGDETGDETGGAMSGAPEPMKPREISRAEITARIEIAMTTDRALVERLVSFWSNHFTIAMRGWYLTSLTGAFEREAVRPHVLGRFRDMLHAAVHNPAMLVYLDNRYSTGPNSRRGKRGKGLNENMAREVLELHTLGVNGGYTQDDVTSFARALTGWSMRGSGEESGTFLFRPNWHEPGPVTIMGRTYPEGGVEQAEAVLDDLAAHPATARHVARKLALHFVGEKAPLSLVERLAAVFRQSDGDLAAVTRALVQSDDAWRAEPRKVLPPYDFVVAVFRALEETPRYKHVTKALSTFGQDLWQAPSPAGWPDEDEAWASPHAVVERLDWVKRVAARSPQSVGWNIIAYADDLFADTLSDFTRQAIARAETREQALALLFMSPEFQRR